MNASLSSGTLSTYSLCLQCTPTMLIYAINAHTDSVHYHSNFHHCTTLSSVTKNSHNQKRPMLHMSSSQASNLHLCVRINRGYNTVHTTVKQLHFVYPLE